MKVFALTKAATKHDNRSWLPAHSQNTYAEVRRCEHRQNQTSVCHDANNGGKSLEFLEVDDGRGHETQQKYKQREESGEAAIGVEWRVVVDGGSAEKAEAEE